MDSATKDNLSQLENLLGERNQSWLLGAGISFDACIPLMKPLTDRVFDVSASENPKDRELLEFLRDEIGDDSHIEYILSHLGDHRAIAERSKAKSVKFGNVNLSVDELDELHQRILAIIADTIRWGYRKSIRNEEEQIGTRDKPIVKVDSHEKFVSALFNRNQAGIAERRKAVRLFTTNYDTLLEDALALRCISYWDGFSGGAIAYRSHRYGDKEPGQDLGHRAHVIKLHGSIDWRLSEDDRVLRVRDGDTYPGKGARVLIYPQSTKYLATQRDPFASQFDLFRRALAAREENVLVTCGYSFGDEHINQEIELSMQRPENKTTILAFSDSLNRTLEQWRRSPWGKRLYVITKDGLYVGANEPCARPTGESLNWWTFAGVTEMLNSGAEAVYYENL